MSSIRKKSIETALQTILKTDFRNGHLALLQALGYSSKKTMPISGASPTEFVKVAEASAQTQMNPNKSKLREWVKSDILFQLTDEELGGQSSLFEATELKPKLLQSYLFFAIELKNTQYSRTDLSNITRQINRLFPMPVMVFFTYNGELSIAVINRRRNKREEHKDVLGKVTLIHGINLTEPHRGHLEILDSFSVSALTTAKQRIDSFDSLHAAWEAIFNVELLNKKFYRELSNWYFWAMRHCHFPLLDETSDRYFLFKDREKVREHEAKNLIRLLTRILFVWFIKERNLVPDVFFDPDSIKDGFLEDFDPESKDTRYYKAILQNFFFAVLNQTHGKREFRKQGQHHNTTNLLRYESLLRSPKRFVKAVEASTPFLNGGLFDCLDYPHLTKKGPQGGTVTIYEDGFSDRKDNPLVVPDFLFFGAEQKGIDLSAEFGDKKKKNETVRGLIHILDSYKFTIVENTPIEQEIALDPELLGQVFENLLASYNEETKKTARKQTGSFYTPRPIVDYMVDESLKAHLRQALVGEATMSEEDAQAGLDILFAYSEREHAFSPSEVEVLIRAIDTCKILDPACGSGAFPMGALQKLVYILGKLDPRDELWEKRQLAKVDRLIEAAQDIDDTTFRERAISDAEAQKRDIEEAFANNELGYGRKLYLIENCLYGVDIQSIATQVSKLRFFISLVVDQKVDAQRDNFGVRPLPNLETKFVTADTLIQIEKPSEQGELFELAEVSKLQRELKQVRHELFAAKTPRTKNAKRHRDKELREAIAEELKISGWDSDNAIKLAGWDPYDQNASAPYFDPEWMFGLKSFDIVIGNPPYGAEISQESRKSIQSIYCHQDYQLDTYLLFIERGVDLLADGGIQSLIIPNTWLPGVMFKSIRRFVLGDTTILGLANIETAVFTAVVDNTILTHRRAKPTNNSFQVLGYTEEGFLPKYIQKQCQWFSADGSPVSIVLTPEKRKIADQISKGQTLESLFTITPGCKPYQRGKGIPKQTADIVKAKPFTSTKRISGEFRPLLRGKLIQKYKVLWDDNLWIKFGEWLAEPRLTANYDAPVKIVLRQTGDSLIAALDENQFIVMNNMFSIVPKSENVHVLFALAALNSSTLNWYYQNVINPEVGEALAEIKKGHLVRLPLAEIDSSAAKVFDCLVLLLQLAKTDTASYREQFLEDLIDACVMESYFRKHMEDRDLLFLDDLSGILEGWDPKTNDSQQRTFLEEFVSTHNAPSAIIRNKLLRLTADSPDLLAVIKDEGSS
ncbi:MAG: TaqI-like C-terminal specificity domain-containing protein [Flavobacteriaceae bacterium]